MRNLKLILFFVCQRVGLFRLAQWLTRKRLRILCYHGFELADETEFRPLLFIKPGQFEQRLAALQRCGFRVAPLDEAIDNLYAGSLPDNTVVITIDDGFHSTHRAALPCLQRHGYPATVYVTTYYVEHPNPIFRLVVQYMFWKTRKGKLTLKNPSWSARASLDLSDAAQRDQAAWDIIRYGEKECSEEMRVALCEELGGLLATPYQAIVQSKCLTLMSPDELRSLADANLTVELHTHRHVFPADDRSLAEREITDNRAALKTFVNTALRHFCYPSGLWEGRQWEWLDGMKVKSSTTCEPGLNTPATPRHALRRILDCADMHPLEFDAAVSGFTELLRGKRGRGERG